MKATDKSIAKPPGFSRLPLLVLRGDEGQTLEDAETEVETEERRERRILVCRQCRQGITDPSSRIQMQGAHRHVFFNPHGIVFEIGCFSQAYGCAMTGSPTMEFTWFEGYAWRIAVCSSCFTHLGWQYLSGSGGSFFGLILSQLEEERILEQ